MKNRERSVEHKSDKVSLRASDKTTLNGHFRTSDGKNVSVYRDPDSELYYGKSTAGEVFVFSDRNSLIENDNIDPVDLNTSEGLKHMARLLELETRDRLIHELREKKADKYSDGDAILNNILSLHIESTEGDLSPIVLNDMNFYRVGENASHVFYLGTNDGRVYYYATSGEPNVKETVLLRMKMDGVDLSAMTEEQVVNGAREFAKDFAREQFNYGSLDQTVQAPSTGASPEEWEAYAVKIMNEEDRLAELWAPVFIPLVRRALDPAVTERFVDVELPEAGPVRIELHNNPKDVTNEKSVYLGRAGYFINPDQLKVPRPADEPNEDA